MKCGINKGPFNELIAPLGKAFKKPPLACSNLTGIQFWRAVASGAVFKMRGENSEWFPVGISSRESSMVVSCKEHDQSELVPAINYSCDMRYWYEIGRHPRFSLVKPLVEANQTAEEIGQFFHDFNVNILEPVKTEEDYRAKIHPRLFTSMRMRGQRYRVRNSFKEKLEKKSFTANDFFEEANQDLRRIMLRSLPIASVLGSLRHVATDDEGVLYDHPLFGRYLYLKCPSTGTEYLLSVPNDARSPMEARRWTFDLEEDAEFVKEA